MLIEFSGKRVLVAGAARGIGRTITEAFAARGAQVWACDLLVEEVEKYAVAASGSERTIHAVKADVTDADSVEQVVGQAQGETGSVDVLVYVAGGVQGQAAAPIESVTVAAWRD